MASTRESRFAVDKPVRDFGCVHGFDSWGVIGVRVGLGCLVIQVFNPELMVQDIGVSLGVIGVEFSGLSFWYWLFCGTGRQNEWAAERVFGIHARDLKD